MKAELQASEGEKSGNPQQCKIQGTNEEGTSLSHLKYRDQYLEVGHETLSEWQKSKMIMNDNSLKLNNDTWNFYGLEQVFAKLQSIKFLKTLLLDHNHNAYILTQIKHVTFSSLIHLNLSFNNVSTLESISDLGMPSLKMLNLSHNKITSISSLRKLYCPNLTSIFLDNNQIRDGSFMVALFTKSLATIRLQQNTYNENYPHKYTIANVNWYFKLQSTCPRILVSSQSMKNKKILCKLKDKIVT